MGRVRGARSIYIARSGRVFDRDSRPLSLRAGQCEVHIVKLSLAEGDARNSDALSVVRTRKSFFVDLKARLSYHLLIAS